jgi:uncharacterized protein YpmB
MEAIKSKLIITLVVMFIAVTAHAQSFYHKKMKRVNRDAANYQCQAVQPRVTFVQSVNHRMSYQTKRKQYRFNTKLKRRNQVN